MKKEELTSREKRRRRRIRSQITAYVTLLCLIIMAGVGVFFGVRAIINGLKAYDDKVSGALSEAETSVPTEAENEAIQSSQESQTGDTASAIEPEIDPLDELVNALLQEMTLEEKVAGMFIVTPESITGVGKVVQAGEGTKTALA